MKKAQVKELAKFAMTVCVWIALGITVSLCSGCASGANMREAWITVNLPPGMTATATIDAQGKGVPAVQVNIGNTTRTVVIETAREADVALPAGLGAAGL